MPSTCSLIATNLTAAALGVKGSRIVKAIVGVSGSAKLIAQEELGAPVPRGCAECAGTGVFSTRHVE